VGLTDARRVRLLDLDITAGFGVEAAGSSRLVLRDSKLAGFFRGVTLDARSGRALIADSAVRGESTAMTIASNHNRVVFNTILGAGVTLTVGGDDNVVARNDLSGGVPVGVDVRGRGNVLARNALHDGSGVTVGEDAVDTLLARNAVTHTIGHGILVENPSTVVRRNVATGNGRLGIDAVAGTIDGGGNRASGNGDARQCLHVACSS
jgi:large repetitive protein